MKALSLIALALWAVIPSARGGETSGCKPGGWYLSAFGGATFYDYGQIEGPNVLSLFERAEYDLDTGWILGGAIGYRTCSNWRFEFEVAASKVDGARAREVLTNTTFNEPLVGNVEKTSLMFNVAREFGDGSLRPYLGAGIGYHNIESTLVRTSPLFGPESDGFDDGAFGYQFMAGLVKDFSPCVQGFLEYRLTNSSEIDGLTWDNGDNVGTFDIDPGHHVVAGFRLFF